MKHIFTTFRRLSLCLTVILTGNVCVNAQELLANGDFEKYKICPASTSNVWYANAYGTWTSVTDWATPIQSSSPDYMNSCSKGNSVSVPLNSIGYRTAHSGNGYVGIYTASNSRSEYIITQLSRPLVKDSIYQVRFFTSPAGCGVMKLTSPGMTFISVREIGAHLSDTLISKMQIGDDDLELPYHVVTNPELPMTDTLRWYEVSGRYTAKGGERWLTIGRFSTAKTKLLYDTVLKASGNATFPAMFGYNYIDDVSVMRVAKKGVSTAVSSQLLAQVSLSPNPVASRLHIGGIDAMPARVQLTITGVTGLLTRSIALAPGEQDIDLSDLPAGTYFLRITAGNERQMLRFVKK